MNTRHTRPTGASAHERYGPYFVYPHFRTQLSFGGERNFEVLVVAFCDPHLSPDRRRLREMRNGIAIVHHSAQHELIILEGHACADRIRRHRPTGEQIREFHRVTRMSWDEFVAFCRASPAVRPRWREPGPWQQLREEAVVPPEPAPTAAGLVVTAS